MLSRQMEEMGLNTFSLDTIHSLDSIIVEGKHENDFEQDSAKFAIAAYEALRANTVTCINTIVNGHLYLGSKEQARRHYVLAAIGITDVLVMAQFAAEPAEAEAFKGSSIRFWDANIPDILGLSFTSVLRAVLHLIKSKIFTEPCRQFSIKDIGDKNEKFKCDNGRVLFVHCIQGVSRSAAVVIGYLMYRLYINLPLNEPIFDFWQVISAVKECRHCCPNLTFMMTLYFLWECLKVLSERTVLTEDKDLRQLRLAEFDRALQLGEFYFESHTRCLSETFGFLNYQILSELQDGMQRVERQGLAALSLKRSLLRDSRYWLSRAVFLRSLNVYMLNIAPGSLELGTIAWERAYERMLIKNGFESNPYIPATQSETFLDPAFVAASQPSSPLSDNTEGITVFRVPLRSSERLTNEDKPLKMPPVPPCLYYEMTDLTVRHKWLATSLGLDEKVPESPWNDFCPSRVLESSVALGTGVARLCQRLMGMFGCRTWSLWLMAMIERDCQELRKNCLAWLNLRQQNSGAFCQSSPPGTEPLGVIAPTVAMSGPDLNKSSSSMAAEVAEAVGDRREEQQQRKRRIRYEDVTVEVLRREIERAKHKLKRINHMLGEV